MYSHKTLHNLVQQGHHNPWDRHRGSKMLKEPAALNQTPESTAPVPSLGQVRSGLHTSVIKGDANGICVWGCYKD